MARLASAGLPVAQAGLAACGARRVDPGPDIERRVIDVFAQYRSQLPPELDRIRSNAVVCWPTATTIQMPASMGIMMMFLLTDGLVETTWSPAPYFRYKYDQIVLMSTRDGALLSRPMSTTTASPTRPSRSWTRG